MKHFMEGKVNTELERLGKVVDRINLQSQVGAMAEENKRLVSWINAISTAED